MRIELHTPGQRAAAKRVIDEAPDGYVVTVAEESRTSAQNRKLWPMLTDLSRQATHAGRSFKPEEWKDLVTAAFRVAEIVPGLYNHGVVALGLSTSNMGVREFARLIEFIYSVGADYDVVWSEPSMATYQEYADMAKRRNDGNKDHPRA